MPSLTEPDAMSFPHQRLDDSIAVAPQLSPEAMSEVAAAGFRSVINNRPDFEGGTEQPTSASIEAAAVAAGLVYVHQPVVSGGQTAEDLARFASLFNSLPKPVLAFCRSGARSGHLWRVSRGL